MDQTWTSLDQFWRSPVFPMWLTLAAAAVVAIVFLVVMLRADRLIANGTLAVMTLLAVAAAAAVLLRGPAGGEQPVRSQAAAGVAALPALSCIDDLAGDGVEAACEKILFGSPDHVAAAVSYAAARLDRLTALGDAAAGGALTPELQALRRAVERDRYGLTAHVLAARDGCTAAMCPAYRSLTDQRQIAANIENRVYDGLVARYAPVWSGASAVALEPNAATTPGIPAAAAIGEPLSIPTGRPTNAEFPSAASIPPVSIMTPEPAAAAPPTPNPASAPAPRPAAPKAVPKAAPKAAAAPAHSPPAATRRPAHPAAPPVQLTPSRGDD